MISRNHSREEIIHDEEKEDKSTNYPTPYLSIFKNKAFLSYMLFVFTQTFMGSVQNSKLPVYLKKVLEKDVGKYGNFTAITCVIGAGSAFISGYAADKLINKKFLSWTNTRNLCALILGIGTSVCLTCIPGVSVKTIYMILCISTFLGDFGSSLMAIASDMTQNFGPFIFFYDEDEGCSWWIYWSFFWWFDLGQLEEPRDSLAHLVLDDWINHDFGYTHKGTFRCDTGIGRYIWRDERGRLVDDACGVLGPTSKEEKRYSCFLF